MFLLKFKFFIVFLTIFSLFLSCGGDGNTGGIDGEKPTAVIDSVVPGDGSFTVSVTIEEGISFTAEAHKTEDFTDEKPVSIEGTGTGSSQSITIESIENEMNYYIRVQAVNSETDKKSDWIEAEGNPYQAAAPATNPPALVVNAVNTESRSITVTLTSEADAVITVEAHKNAAFGDTTPVSVTKTSSDNNSLEFVLDVEFDEDYYVRAQATKNSLTSAWVEGADNPYLVPSNIGDFLITDITPLPDSSNILVEAQGLEATNISLNVASDQGFTSLITLSAGDLTEVITGDTRTITISDLPLDTSLYFRTVSSTGGIVDVYSTPVIVTDGTLVTQHIHRLSELAKIGVDTMNYPLSGTYLLEKDLNFADADNDGTLDDSFDADTDSSNGNWIPIAPETQNSFAGTFDGQDHTITGMNINEPKTGTAMIDKGVGFFGNTDSATISNLGLIDMVVLTNGKYAGGLGGIVTDTTIKNSYVKGSSEVNTYYPGALAGGLLGFLIGTLSNSYALVDVGTMSGLLGTGRGGLVGGMYNNAIVLNSYASGSVAGFSDVGGLVGYLNRGSITSSYATGTVTGFKDPANQSEPQYIGGLVGGLATSITNLLLSFAVGDVLLGDGATTGNNFGGLTGNTIDNITYCYVYDGQTVDVNDGLAITGVDSATLGTAAFYTREFVDNGGTGDVPGLDWDGDTPGSAEWHITGPITNGNFPRVNKDGETSDTAANEVPGQEDISIPSSS